LSQKLRFLDVLILIKGAGDLASGVAYRLKRSGFAVVMTELPNPLLVRRAVCFGDAVYTGETMVEGISARSVKTVAEARQLAASDVIPVLVDPQTTAVEVLKPQVVVDAVMAKTNTGTTINHAPLVVALGPGFIAGKDCHAIIETNRGHNLGRVINEGQAETDTQTPGTVKGYTADRVLRAPAAGQIIAVAKIGDPMSRGQLIATVNGQEVRAPFPGVLRGLIHSSGFIPLWGGHFSHRANLPSLRSLSKCDRAYPIQLCRREGLDNQKDPSSRYSQTGPTFYPAWEL